MTIERHKFDSSNIMETEYDTITNTLRVLFKEGKIYEYYGVPQSVMNNLINAESAGKFFHKNIRFSFEYVKLK